MRQWLMAVFAIFVSSGTSFAQTVPSTEPVKPLLIMPFVQMDRGEPGVVAPVGGYTRLYARWTPPDDAELRDYQAEKRGWLKRLFVGKAISRVLSAKVTVGSPGVISTVTLASASHQSNRNVGETWSTTLATQQYLTPYFRVDPNSKVKVELDLNGNMALQSQVAGNILDVLKRATALVSPESKLITSLNEKRFNDAGQFVDETISSLFGQSVTENVPEEFGPKDLGGSKAMASVKIVFPMMNKLVLRRAKPREIGSWDILSEPAVISMFSDVPLITGDEKPAVEPCTATSLPALASDLQACRAFARLSAAAMLNLLVADNITLGAVIGADDAILTAIDAVKAAEGDAREAPAIQLCLSIAAKVDKLRLNMYDAAATVWAFSYGGRLEPEAAAFLRKADCPSAKLAAQLNLL
jgi:hypothetical protein